MAEYLFNLGIILIFYISLSALYTVRKNTVFLSSPSFLLYSSGPDRQVPNTKGTPDGQSTERGQNKLKLVLKTPAQHISKFS